MMRMAPMAQDRIAAGPAMLAASKAPKSHPEPMIEPTPVKSSPVLPISRLSPLSWTTVTLVCEPDDRGFHEGTFASQGCDGSYSAASLLLRAHEVNHHRCFIVRGHRPRRPEHDFSVSGVEWWYVSGHYVRLSAQTLDRVCCLPGFTCFHMRTIAMRPATDGSRPIPLMSSGKAVSPEVSRIRRLKSPNDVPTRKKMMARGHAHALRLRTSQRSKDQAMAPRAPRTTRYTV